MLFAEVVDFLVAWLCCILADTCTTILLAEFFSALCIWSLLFRSGVAKDVRVKDLFEAWVLVEGLCRDEKTSLC